MAHRGGGLSKSVIARVTGRVQGVGFRAWTEQEAIARGLNGWVRNRRDGSVEAQLCGPESLVDDMVGALRSGPPSADVESVSVASSDDEVGIGFRTLPTA